MALLIAPFSVPSVSTPYCKTLATNYALIGRSRSSCIGRKSRFNPLKIATQPSVPEQGTFESDLSRDEVYSSEIEEENGKIDTKFTWKDHWYPVSLIEDLDPLKLTPFQLLGRNIVLWKDRAAAEWVALDGRCPHRLAPLSEERIDEEGNLHCSYHGWSFDRCGSCTRIPQAASEGPEARAVKSPKACATKLPTLVSQGLLFCVA